MAFLLKLFQVVDRILDLWVYLCPKAHAKDYLENTILDIDILGQAKDIDRSEKVPSAEWL